MKKLSKKKIVDIQGKIEYEGLDYYLTDGGWAREDFKQTELEPFLNQFLVAREVLINKLKELGVEI